MSSVISLSRFKAETELCNQFILTYEDPLTPISLSLRFDHIAVSISASPYIALKNNDMIVCLSHIESIRRYRGTDKENGFIFVCNDYSMSNTPEPVKVFLKCKKAS